MDSARRRNVRTPILRAYMVTEKTEDGAAGKSIAEVGLFKRSGLIVERIKRGSELLEPEPDLVLQVGDKAALVGFPSSHARNEIDRSDEVYDPDLLEFRMDTANVVVTNPDMVGIPLADLDLETRYGCLVNGLTRAQVELPLTRHMILERGDVLEVSGEHGRLKKFAKKLGSIEQESDLSDLMTFSFFFLGGMLMGQFAILFGDLRVTLGNAGGLLLAGIVMGYFRARNPVFGYMPQGAINVLKDLGLNIFMVSVGLAAGTDIVDVLMASGPAILIGGACIMLCPLLVGYLYGALVLKMNPVLLLGALTGAMTSTPALKSLNDMTDSAVPALGYAGTYTFANVFLTLGGASIIML
jgi:putative transport protein